MAELPGSGGDMAWSQHGHTLLCHLSPMPSLEIGLYGQW